MARNLFIFGRTAALFVAAAVAVASVCAAGRTQAQITPRTDAITLDFGGTTLRPKRVISPWRAEVAAGSHRLVLTNRSVSEHDSKTDRARWTAIASEGYTLTWMASAGDIAYLSGANPDVKKPADRLLRLDLKTGSWLPNIPIKDTLIAVMPGSRSVCVLTASLIDAPFPQVKKMVSYQVINYWEPGLEPMWQREFTAEPEAGHAEAYLLAAQTPIRANSNIQHLTKFSEDVVVCAGARQALIALNLKTGKTSWANGRIWEFQRGFVGPSVWSHFIARAGNQFDSGLELDAQKSKAFDEKYSCSIVAGPLVVVDTNENSRLSGEHLFVAVARAEKGPYSTYLSDCVVYEIDKYHRIVSTAKLPRMIDGSQRLALPNRLIWGCANNALVSLSPYEKEITDEPGSPDLTTFVSWYRQYVPYENEAWLSSDADSSLAAFGPRAIYRLHAGGFDMLSTDNTYQFPISKIDPLTGEERTLILRVPFTGKLNLPRTNFSRITLGSVSYTHAMGTYELAISQLTVDGPILKVTLVSDKWSATVVFDMDDAGAGSSAGR